MKNIITQHEQFENNAWLTTALLAYLHMGVGMTDLGLKRIEEVKQSPEQFITHLRQLTEVNKFGFNELDKPEAIEVMKFLGLNPEALN